MLKGFKDFHHARQRRRPRGRRRHRSGVSRVWSPSCTKSFLEPLVVSHHRADHRKSRPASAASTPTFRGILPDWVAFVNATITFLLTRDGALLTGGLPDEQLAGRAAQAGRGAAAGRPQRGGQAAHRDPGRAAGRRPHHPGPAAARPDDVLGRSTSEPPPPR